MKILLSYSNRILRRFFYTVEVVEAIKVVLKLIKPVKERCFVWYENNVI